MTRILGGKDGLPDEWEKTAEMLRKTAETVLGVTFGKRKGDKETWWWNEEVQKSIKEKKEAKKTWDKTRNENTKKIYKEKKSKAKKAVAMAKGRVYDDLYARLETKEGEKELYRLARQRDRAGKDVQHVRVMKDENSNVMVNSEAVLKRCKEYFEKLMNEENNREPRTEEAEVVKEEVNCVSREEVKNELRRMKKSKTVGPDELPVEVWKCMSEMGIEFLTRLFPQTINGSSSSSSFEGHPLQARHKQNWGRGFILLLPQTAALPESDAGSDVIKPASSFVIQNRQTACSMW